GRSAPSRRREVEEAWSMNLIARVLGLGFLAAACAVASRASEGLPRLVVRNALLVTLDGSGRAPFHGFFVVDADGRIEALGAGEPPATAAPVFDARGRIVLPGFLSGHSHLQQSVTRGRAAGSWVTEWGR